MSSHFTVVYDACVLYPAPLRDLLMRLALTDRFRARWSNTIHDEWIRNLLKQRPELDPAALEKTMQHATLFLRIFSLQAEKAQFFSLGYHSVSDSLEA